MRLGDFCSMTKSEILRAQAQMLRDLATDSESADIKELLLHLAEQCDSLAERLEEMPC
jgi:hypothetical protein